MKRFDGWILVAWAALLGVALAAIAFAIAGPGEAGLRLGLRLSARESFAIFLAVFAASPLHAARPSRETKWLLRNRRALGVALATSQAIHLILIVALAAAYPRSFAAGLATTTAVVGGVGFVLLALMTATSFDRPAAALGRRAWRVLHTTGVWTLFVIFAASYAALAYWILVAPLLAIAALRIWLRLIRRR
jgi:DMSO/TMAO reductase YedYZ heme-binding membrane subunit